MFLLSSLISYAQSSQSLQAGIISNSANNRFCEGNPEWFQLEARATGGTEPYHYEWTFSWNTDTLHEQTIITRPETSGEVRLKVTDSSRPPISRDTKYRIYETSIDADFTFNAANSCAQTPITFTPVASEALRIIKYLWNFGDGSTSTKEIPYMVLLHLGVLACLTLLYVCR